MEFRSAHTLDGVERTEDIEIEENVTFEEMYLSEAVLSGLHACGFVKPSPIQLSAIPLGRCGLDLVVQAKSGTGKTCVFSVVALEMISVIAKTTQVLVVAPTREIAVQIGEVINSIGSAMPELKTATFIGGTSVEDDKAKLRCCHIAIGTPGRLNQLVSLGNLDLSNVRLLVLDEADELLTGQFRNCILELVKSSPLNKQVLALSATYPPDVTEFLDKFMRSPSHVRLGKESPALIGVLQFVRLLPDHPQSHQRHKTKFTELLSILSTVSFNQCLVFSNSQLRAESVCNQLKSNGWPASFLTGGQVQKDRLQAFYALCSYKCRILVSTDLSARGLDSEYVNLVINLDIPIDQATYLHRVGRAGRFGSKGIAVSLVCEGEEWETMRAVATLTNVQVRILYENYDSYTFEEKDNLEMVEYLDRENCALWVEKQNKKKMKYKSKSENKENICGNKKKAKVASAISPDQEKSKTSSKKCIKKEIQDGSQLLKDILHDYATNSEVNTFTHKEILNQILEKWETHSKCDTPHIAKTSYLKKYPPVTLISHLDSYITKRDKKHDLTEMPETQNLTKDLAGLLEDLQCVMQGKPLQLPQPIHESTECELEVKAEADVKEISEKNLEDNHTCEIKDNAHDESITQNSVSEKENDSRSKQNEEKEAASAERNSLHDPSGDVKEQQKKLKQKKFTENTGYGEWVTVMPEEKYSHETANKAQTFYQENYSYYDHESYKPNSDHYNDYFYEESDEFSPDLGQPSNKDFDHHNHYSHYCASLDGYIRSATKFAEMMEYVRNVGRMSAWIAQNQTKEDGSCVLLRALEPVEGLEEMHKYRQERRQANSKELKTHQLCNGPSKLCQAMNIRKENCNKLDLSESQEFWLEDGVAVKRHDIVVSKRIGIESAGEEWANKPLRFYVLGNPCVSVKNHSAEALLRQSHSLTS